jgi:hypothetical protein
MKDFPCPLPDTDDFLLKLIWDLQIEAEKAGMKPYYYRAQRYRSNQHEPLEPFKCSKCGHFHAHNYIIGKKPTRCLKCHNVF